MDKNQVILALTNPDMENVPRITFERGNAFMFAERIIDHENVIYRVHCVFYRNHPFYPTDVLFEEMTPWNAADRFEELYNKIILSEALFGWIGER